MPRLIVGDKVVDDPFRLIETEAAASFDPAQMSDAIVPLAWWRAQRELLGARGVPAGVWLHGHDDPQPLLPDLGCLRIVAIRFPKFTDGRGYSLARLLRERMGFAGQLRAVGDVQRDQLHYLRRVGFDAFSLSAGKDVDSAVASLALFSESYQAAVDQPLPLFRRRAAATCPTE
jgi:uncharacterized protein (DUF934 family)